jgi:hypothetical protein
MYSCAPKLLKLLEAPLTANSVPMVTVHPTRTLTMNIPSYGVVLIAAGLLAPSLAGSYELDSREYKLMLQHEQFAGTSPAQAVARYTRDQLVPAVRESWGEEAGKELSEKGLQLDKQRLIQFRDTHDCLLSRHGFALRARAELNEQGQPKAHQELTLKFRSPDAFLPAGLNLKVREGAEKLESKLEEDLGPVAVRTGQDVGIAAKPRTARSQFSRSTSQTVKPNAAPTTLGEIEILYPNFKDDLYALAGHVSMSDQLVGGPLYRELVYKSSKLELAVDFKSTFSLTIWYEGDDNLTKPSLAEISFSYKTKDGHVSSDAAQRSMALLLSLQDLSWADPGAPTKSALVACPD